MATGQYSPRTSEKLVCSAWKALPKYNRAKLTFAESKPCCAERGHAPSTSLIPNWRRTKTADSHPKRQRRGWLLGFSPTSSVNTMDVTVSRHGCPEQRASSVTPARVMQSARDGDTNTEFPVDYTQKKPSVGFKCC